MKYKYTILYVKNVTKTIEFYEKAFGFNRIFITPENDYAELNTGETRLSFASTTLAASNLKHGFEQSDLKNKAFGIELAFTSENIDADFEKAIHAGAVLYEKISEKPWGQKVGYLRDLNGFLIEIGTPMK